MVKKAEMVKQVCKRLDRDQLREIEPPIGLQIINHTQLGQWFKQGYAEQRYDGLWLHYTAICELLRK